MSRVASLGMYDAPHLHSANDVLWTAIAGHLRAAGVADSPKDLDRSRPLEAIWADPSLLLASICGYPLATAWRGQLRYVATPVYRATGCQGTAYRSRIVVRTDDGATSLSALRGRRIAVNALDSNSGMNLLRAMVAPLAKNSRFFGSVVITGSHDASTRAVASGEADAAAIDCLTFAHLEAADPALTCRLRTLAWSAASPGLPLVTAMSTTDGELRALRQAIRRAVRDEAHAEAVGALLMTDIEVLRPARYDTLRKLEERAARLGYPELG